MKNLIIFLVAIFQFVACSSTSIHELPNFENREVTRSFDFSGLSEKRIKLEVLDHRPPSMRQSSAELEKLIQQRVAEYFDRSNLQVDPKAKASMKLMISASQGEKGLESDCVALQSEIRWQRALKGGVRNYEILANSSGCFSLNITKAYDLALEALFQSIEEKLRALKDQL